MINYTGKTQSKAGDRPQIGRNQAFSAYSPPAKQGQAQPSYGATQQQGGLPSVPQQGQQSAPDMSVYRQQASGQSGFRYPSSPPPSMGTVTPPPAEGPVAVQDPSGVQRQIDDLKRRGTWDDPRNAAARQRMESKLRNINAAPPGYFITPDGRLEPNYRYSLGGASGPVAPQQTQATAQGGFGNIVPLDYLNLVGRAADEWASNQYVPPPAPPPSDILRAPTPPGNINVPPGVSAINDLWNYRPPGQAPSTASGGLQNQLATRDAFIASINNSLAQQQANGFNTQGAAPPQFNFPALYQQANQMVANGWSNPLAGLFR